MQFAVHRQTPHELFEIQDFRTSECSASAGLFFFYINPNPKFRSDIRQYSYLHGVLCDLFVKIIETR